MCYRWAVFRGSSIMNRGRHMLSPTEVWALFRQPIHAFLSGDCAVVESPTLIQFESQIPPEMMGLLHHIRLASGQTSSDFAEEKWTENVHSHLERIAVMTGVWGEFDGPPPLVFKGADFVENLYHDPGIRQSVDIDLCLPGKKMDAFLEHFGEEVKWADPPQYERFPSDTLYAHGVNLRGISVDIHRAFEPLHRCRLDAEKVYQRSELGRLGACPVRFPCAQDRLLLWLINLIKAGSTPDPMALIDLSMILRKLGVMTAQGNYEALIEHAREHQLLSALMWAIDRLKESLLWPGQYPTANGWVDSARRRTLHQVMPKNQASRFATPDVFRRQLVKLTFCPRGGLWGLTSRLAFTQIQRWVKRS